MRNRFNITEEEKNRIRGLHGMQVLTEQGGSDGNARVLWQCVSTLAGNDKSVRRITSIIRDTLDDECAGIIMGLTESGQQTIDIIKLEDEMNHCWGVIDYASKILEWIEENWDELSKCIRYEQQRRTRFGTRRKT